LHKEGNGLKRVKKALIFGAGSIGRGFIGELMQLSGFDISFVDVNEALIHELSKVGSYTLEIVSNSQVLLKEIIVDRVIFGRDERKVAEAVESADIIFTAVGQEALKFIAKPVALGVERRKSSVNIILCENMMNADSVFRQMVKSHAKNANMIEETGFLRASVGRMVPVPSQEDGLLKVKAEPYYHLPVDSDGIVGNLPDFYGCEKISPFDFAMERKLYIHNLGHAACAWLGQQKNYNYIYEAVNNVEIRALAKNAMFEAAKALSIKYGKDIAEMTEHINDLLFRFENKLLGDTVSRVGKDTKRKLSPGDRAVGAYNLCKEYKLPNDAIKAVIFAGLEFINDDEGTKYIKEQVIQYGSEKVFKNLVCINA
jgi:mannitol-1-phosphate 5-dehydrogenase